MIKKILKYFIYLLLFLYMMVIFAPKINIYYFALEKLESYKIALLSEEIKDNYLAFDVKNVLVNYDGIDVSRISKLSIGTYLFSSKLTIDNVEANNLLKNFIPQNIQSIHLSHNILTPLYVKINIAFAQGRAFGTIDLKEKKIDLNFDVTKSFIQKYKELSRDFKKNGKYYTYEFKY